MTHETKIDYVYFTASTLDGFLADESDSLEWLLHQPLDEKGPFNIDEFMRGVSVVAMGYTTYAWVVEHLAASGEQWPYGEQSTFVFTHRDPELVHESITVVAGPPSEHRAHLESAAGQGTVWVVGGGDLAAQFAEDAMLDEVVVSYAPATVGAGRPLFTKPFDFELVDSARNGAFIVGRYRVLGPRPASS